MNFGQYAGYILSGHVSFEKALFPLMTDFLFKMDVTLENELVTLFSIPNVGNVVKQFLT